VLALVLAATCLVLPSKYAGLDVDPLNPHTFVVNQPNSRASYAYDGVFEYVGTSTGLYRTRSIASQTDSAFDYVLSGRVNAVSVQNGVIYALMEGGEVLGRAQYHTILRSTDTGNTWSYLDAGLEECLNGFCRFLPANQIDFAPGGKVFVSAGGNLLLTADDFATWKVLSGVTSGGHPAMQSCPMVFDRKEQQVVMGGECPLDSGFVSTAVLRSDLLDWQSPPHRLNQEEIAPLENRNAQFVEHAGDDVFVGVEGGLLKSCDFGATFHYVIRFPLSGGTHYPYAHQFLAPSRYPNVRIIAGFDKATSGPYLAWSSDGGNNWIDASGLLPPDSTVALLTERRDGLPMIFVQRAGNLLMDQLVLSELPLRRRGVKH
jgi:hypothetical protein